LKLVLTRLVFTWAQLTHIIDELKSKSVEKTRGGCPLMGMKFAFGDRSEEGTGKVEEDPLSNY
jgi:hypothetical protein